MLDRVSKTIALRVLLKALVLCCAAGCSSSDKFGVMLFADPGRYEWNTCDQIAVQHQRASKREQVLKGLIEKAEQGAGGTFVSAVAYRGEYRTVQEDLAVIEATARRRNCLTTDSWRSNSVIQ